MDCGPPDWSFIKEAKTLIWPDCVIKWEQSDLKLNGPALSKVVNDRETILQNPFSRMKSIVVIYHEYRLVR